MIEAFKRSGSMWYLGDVHTPEGFVIDPTSKLATELDISSSKDAVWMGGRSAFQSRALSMLIGWEVGLLACTVCGSGGGAK
jgi:hypothetical protein